MMGSREIDSPKVENEGPLGIPAAYERVPFSIGEVFNFHPVLTDGAAVRWVERLAGSPYPQDHRAW